MHSSLAVYVTTWALLDPIDKVYHQKEIFIADQRFSLKWLRLFSSTGSSLLHYAEEVQDVYVSGQSYAQIFRFQLWEASGRMH